MANNEIAQAGDGQSGKSVDAGSIDLSQQIAQMRIADATDKQPKATATDAEKAAEAAGTMPKEGPLGAFAQEDPMGIGKFVPALAEADAKWQKPYQELTNMDGHRLLDRYDTNLGKAQGEINLMPPEDSKRIVELANQYVTPRLPIESAKEAELAKYPGLLEACKEMRKINADPNFPKAMELREEVRNSVGDGIDVRRKIAQDLASLSAEGMGIKTKKSPAGSALAYIMEAQQLTRYLNGGWR